MDVAVADGIDLVGVEIKVDVVMAVAVELGSGARDENTLGILLFPLQAVRNMQATSETKNFIFMSFIY